MRLPNQLTNVDRCSHFSAGAIQETRRKMTPQQYGIDDVLTSNCIPNCLCVSPIGCPCCDSLFSFLTRGQFSEGIRTI